MNYIQKFEQNKIKQLLEGKKILDFNVGDTIKVNVRIVEANNSERIQGFKGVVIAKANRGIDSSFVVRKISHGIGVEKKFKLFSPMIKSIEYEKSGIVKRAKLYYLRKLKGKAARIKEKLKSND